MCMDLDGCTHACSTVDTFLRPRGSCDWGSSIRVRICVHYSDDIRLAFVLPHGRDEDDLPLGKILVLLIEAVDMEGNLGQRA